MTEQLPVDLRADGVLWMINKTVFHPRGYALALDVETGDLTLMGDGSEPWTYDHAIEDNLFAAFNALLDRAKKHVYEPSPPREQGEHPPCRICGMEFSNHG